LGFRAHARVRDPKGNHTTVAILVILVLAILWAAVLLPPILRSRSEAGDFPGGVGEFLGKLRSGLGHGRQQDAGLPPLQPLMGPIGGPATTAPPVGPVQASRPGGMSPTQRRRRDVLIGLLAAAGLTFLMAFLAGSMTFWLLNLLADALLGGYVYLLLQLKARQQFRGQAARPMGAGMATPLGATNVHSLDSVRQRQPMPSHVEAPRGATVLALRRTAAW
jgi:hypothetical protein